MRHHLPLSLLLLFTLFSLALPVQAEQAADLESIKHFGKYEIHYSVFNTSFISPEVSRSYGIVRAKDKAMLNVSVLMRGKDGIKRPVTAKVSGTQSDLIHKLEMQFKEVREQNALYYLASFDIRHKTKVFFYLLVQPEGESSPIKVEFNRTLYKDE